MNYIAEWLDSYRRFWELRMARLEEYLRKLQENESNKNGKKIGREVESNDSKPIRRK
jgi:hypothetical protein